MVILESKRLLFRKHIPDDLDAYCAMEMDADFRRFVGGRPRTREEAEKKFTGVLRPVKGRLSMWATVLKPTEEYIGRCGVYPHFDASGKAIAGEGSLGFYLAPEYWNKGFATEAGRAFISFGFNELGLNRIVTMIDTRNDASVHVIQKLGFKLAATETGDPRSFYHYALTKAQF